MLYHNTKKKIYALTVWQKCGVNLGLLSFFVCVFFKEIVGPTYFW